MTGRHSSERADGAWDARTDAEVTRALREWFNSRPLAPAIADVPTCPRCGAQRPTDYGSKIGCGNCGHLWQAGAASAPEPPLSPRERYVARRKLDERQR